MARYYFDSFDGVELSRDELGRDLPTREAARHEAQRIVAEVVGQQLPDGHRRDFIVDVRDAHGILIYTCTLGLSGRWVDHSVAPLENREDSV